ncbi:MAG: HU family DNA-binding protein [Bacteroides sp.]|nr:HU family DNA-binding protein [Bacteroides sp.]MBQ8240904.1 HU family DNA-binding protein [Bacteroides sp.]
MPLNYSIAMLPNPMEKNDPHKAYAKAQINGEMSLKELSKEVSNKCTVHSADVSAVLIATVETMLAALRDGKQVDFGELGKFRLQITSKGAITAEDFTADNITGVTIQFIPGDDLKGIFKGMEFNLVPSRYAQAALLRAQKKGETTVDLSKPGENEEEEAA